MPIAANDKLPKKLDVPCALSLPAVVRSDLGATGRRAEEKRGQNYLENRSDPFSCDGAGRSRARSLSVARQRVRKKLPSRSSAERTRTSHFANFPMTVLIRPPSILAMFIGCHLCLVRKLRLVPQASIVAG